MLTLLASMHWSFVGRKLCSQPPSSLFRAVYQADISNIDEPKLSSGDSDKGQIGLRMPHDLISVQELTSAPILREPAHH